MLSKLRSERRGLKELAGSIADEGKLAAVWKKALDNAENTAGLRIALGEACCELMLKSDDRAMAANYFLSFGSGDINAEIERLQGLVSELKASEEQERNSCEKRMKLASPLALLAGAALALLVL